MSPLAVLALIGVILPLVATLGASLMQYPIFWKYSRGTWHRMLLTDARARSPRARS